MQFMIGDKHVMIGGCHTHSAASTTRNFLDYILDDLMPWHREPELRDFSFLEVNRYTLLVIFCDCSAFDVYLQRYNSECAPLHSL